MISKLASSIRPSATLEITAKANKLKEQGVNVISFAAGEADFDTPDYIKRAACDAIMQGFTKYTPVAGTVGLREAIANKLLKENNICYTSNQIVVSNGAKHSLTNAFMAILNPGDEVLIAAPFWLSYPEMVKMAGGVTKIIYTKRENDFKLTPELLQEAITEKTKAIIINSPSNPTGVVYTDEELMELGELAVKNHLWIISDEIYEHLIYGESKHVSMASLSESIYNRTITVNGLSKSYAMTGWRIGYLAAPLEVAKAVGSIQSHATSNPNAMAQKAAQAALEYEGGFLLEMKNIFEKRAAFLYEGLCKIEGLQVVKPQGAFYCFVDLSNLYGKKYKETTIHSAMDFAKLILEEVQVAVVPCADFGAPECIRLSYATGIEMLEEGLNRVNVFVKMLK